MTTKSTKQGDIINHPDHYASKAGGIECIEAMEAMVGTEGFEAHLRCQVLKYLWRYQAKGSPGIDLKKAQFYLDRLISLADDEDAIKIQDDLETLRWSSKMHGTDSL